MLSRYFVCFRWQYIKICFLSLSLSLSLSLPIIIIDRVHLTNTQKYIHEERDSIRHYVYVGVLFVGFTLYQNFEIFLERERGERERREIVKCETLCVRGFSLLVSLFHCQNFEIFLE